MSFDFSIPTAGGYYSLPQTTLDFNIKDLTGSPPVVTPASFTIAENKSIGYAVGTISGSDVDLDTLTWSITSGNTGGAFAIDSATGAITVASALSYHDKPSYTLVVRATDPSSLYGEANVTIALTSTAPTVTGASFTILESLAIGAAVGNISATDPDDSSFTWSIRSGNTGGGFAINSGTGAITVAAALSYPTTPSYTLVVRATDPGGRYGEASVTIALTSTAPVVTPASFTIPEDIASGGNVGTVAVSDADDSTFTWSIRSGNVGAAFAINSSGVITAAAVLDYRTRPNYTLVVRATDPGGRYGEANIAIALTSTSPVVTPATFSVGENAAIGAVVGTVVAEDPQGDLDLTFAITSGNTGGAFAIDAESGVITVAAKIDFETKPTYTLTVLVTDSTGRWGAGLATVNLIDEIDIYLPPAPELIRGLTMPWAKGFGGDDSELHLPFVSMRPLDKLAVDAWTRLRALDQPKDAAWQRMVQQDVRKSLLWTRQGTADQNTAMPWKSFIPRDSGEALNWNGAMQARDLQLTADWKQLNIADRGAAVVFTSFDALAPEGSWFDLPEPVASGAGIEITWPLPGLDFFIRLTDAYSLPQETINFNIADVSPYEPPAQCDFHWPPVRFPTFRPHAVDSIERLPWVFGHPVDQYNGFRNHSLSQLPGAGVGLPWNNDPPDHDEIVVPPLKVYNVMNSISVVRLPERTVINPISLQLNYDDSTFCWTGSFVLASETEANLLKPTSTTPREIEVSVNGFVWVLSIQTRARERKFPSKSWTLQAKGRQAYLADPYVLPRSLISDSDKSAAQLAIDELPSGWTLDWNVPDWIIPAGMWSYDQLTPIQAIGRLAAAVGGIVQPDLEDQHIVIRSRYPVSPVQWDTVTPDISLPDALCTTLSDSDQPGQLRNQVVIEASRSPGRRTVCTRAGTGGDAPMPSITEELNTDVTCGQERGRVELDSTGPWIDQSIAIPILETPGLILPGKLLEVTEGGNSWRGLTRGISIAVQRSDAGWATGQSLRIERREAA